MKASSSVKVTDCSKNFRMNCMLFIFLTMMNRYQELFVVSFREHLTENCSLFELFVTIILIARLTWSVSHGVLVSL